MTVGSTKPETIKASKGRPVTWDEVQGVDAAKDELLDVAEWLREPDRFKSLGAAPPRGVLLYGPPGTGKTMLARAVAAQANCDFYAASGSSFVEMFVGRGAARIRRLFKEARKSGRAVIFIDEIDAVGGHRSGGGGDGGTSEREQALNQLLVELDGFEKEQGTVIVIAASNNVDKLDAALLRPGRFDRRVLGRAARPRRPRGDPPRPRRRQAARRRPRPHRRRPQDDRDDRRSALQRLERGGDHRRARGQGPGSTARKSTRRCCASRSARSRRAGSASRSAASSPTTRPATRPAASCSGSTRRRSSRSSPAARRSASSATRRRKTAT